jgi:DNA polymerase III alpha subunit
MRAQNIDQNRQKLLQFLEETLGTENKNSERIHSNLQEFQQFGVEILPLDINASRASCAFEGEDKLRIGFSVLIPGDDQIIEDIITEREKNGRFTTFQDFCERIDIAHIPEEFLTRCIEAGIFDSTGASRAQLFQGYQKIIQAVLKAKTDREIHQISLFDALPASSLPPVTLPEAEAWSEDELIDHEKNALGFSFTEYLQRDEEAIDPLEQNELEPPPQKEPSFQEKASRSPSAVIIRLTTTTTESILLQLKELLHSYPGDVHVMLEFTDDNRHKTLLKTHNNYSIDVSEKLVEEVKKLLGEQTVRVQYDL